MDRLTEIAHKNVIRFGKFDVAKTPPLWDSLSLATTEPKQVLRTFAIFHTIIKDLFTLSDEELHLIEQVNEKLHKPRGAHEFMEHMRTYNNEILDIVRHAGDMNVASNQQGITELATMMGNAWKLKQNEPNWKPTDGDNRADNVIWGFVNGASDAQTDIDFTICHGIERIVTEHLRDKNIDYTHHKDWLLSAMTDVVVLRGLQGKHPEKTVLPLWTLRRPDGLGWVSQSRLNAYKEFLAKPH